MGREGAYHQRVAFAAQSGPPLSNGGGPPRSYASVPAPAPLPARPLRSRSLSDRWPPCPWWAALLSRFSAVEPLALGDRPRSLGRPLLSAALPVALAAPKRDGARRRVARHASVLVGPPLAARPGLRLRCPHFSRPPHCPPDPPPLLTIAVLGSLVVARRVTLGHYMLASTRAPVVVPPTLTASRTTLMRPFTRFLVGHGVYRQQQPPQADGVDRGGGVGGDRDSSDAATGALSAEAAAQDATGVAVAIAAAAVITADNRGHDTGGAAGNANEGDNKEVSVGDHGAAGPTSVLAVDLAQTAPPTTPPRLSPPLPPPPFLPPFLPPLPTAGAAGGGSSGSGTPNLGVGRSTVARASRPDPLFLAAAALPSRSTAGAADGCAVGVGDLGPLRLDREPLPPAQRVVGWDTSPNVGAAAREGLPRGGGPVQTPLVHGGDLDGLATRHPLAYPTGQRLHYRTSQPTGNPFGYSSLGPGLPLFPPPNPTGSERLASPATMGAPTAVGRDRAFPAGLPSPGDAASTAAGWAFSPHWRRRSPLGQLAETGAETAGPGRQFPTLPPPSALVAAAAAVARGASPIEGEPEWPRASGPPLGGTPAGAGTPAAAGGGGGGANGPAPMQLAPAVGISKRALSQTRTPSPWLDFGGGGSGVPVWSSRSLPVDPAYPYQNRRDDAPPSPSPSWWSPGPLVEGGGSAAFQAHWRGDPRAQGRWGDRRRPRSTSLTHSTVLDSRGAQVPPGGGLRRGAGGDAAFPGESSFRLPLAAVARGGRGSSGGGVWAIDGGGAERAAATAASGTDDGDGCRDSSGVRGGGSRGAAAASSDPFVGGGLCRVDLVDPDERFRCDACGRSFSQRYNLNRHRRVVHLKQRLYRCPLCPTAWQQRDHLKKHLRVMHDAVAPRLCTECGRTFRAADTLAAHKRVCEGQFGGGRAAEGALWPSGGDAGLGRGGADGGGQGGSSGKGLVERGGEREVGNAGGQEGSGGGGGDWQEEGDGEGGGAGEGGRAGEGSSSREGAGESNLYE